MSLATIIKKIEDEADAHGQKLIAKAQAEGEQIVARGREEAEKEPAAGYPVSPYADAAGSLPSVYFLCFGALLQHDERSEQLLFPPPHVHALQSALPRPGLLRSASVHEPLLHLRSFE